MAFGTRMPRRSGFIAWLCVLVLALVSTGCKKMAPPASMAPGGAYADSSADGADSADPATTWKRSTLDAHRSRISVGDHESIPLRRAEIRARVDGFRARVMLDLFFDNDYRDGLEGTFQLRLPEGASPYLLAFGQTQAQAPALRIATDAPDAFTPTGAMAARAPMWSNPREAVMAERERAAVAYGQTVRRSVDPALAEWAGAGVFNARVFPLARGLNRVVVGYDVDLVRIGDDLELTLPLPPGVDASQVALDVVAGESPVTVTPTVAPRVVGEHSLFEYATPQADRVTVRIQDAPAQWLAGTDPSVGDLFATRFTPALPDEPAEAGPTAAVFMVDTSLSSNPERFEIWRSMVRTILERDRAGIDRFAVVFFSIDTRWWKRGFVSNTPDNVDALLRHTDGLSLEGATDLGAALSEAMAPTWMEDPVPRTTFLLGDGAATWGEDDVFALGHRWRATTSGPLFTYDTGIEGGSGQTLQQLARETGGARFSVVGASELATAAVAHRARPWELLGVSVDGADDLVLEGRPQALYPGQRLTLVGRGRPAPGTAVELQLRQGRQIRTIRTPIETVIDSPLAPRRYAEVVVSQLEPLAEITRPAAVAYARHFRITGRTCSLVMLETDEDYARAEIGGHDDAAMVRREPAATLVADALERLGARLGDPKGRVLAQLRRLDGMPGVMAHLPRPVMDYLQTLPSSSFTVEAEALTCAPRLTSDVPSALRAQLRTRQPEYDLVVEDAQRRLELRDNACALVSLSSMVEASPGDAVLARDVAFTAASWGLPGQSARLLQRVAQARPYEPLTYHALAQTLADIGRDDLAIAYYEVALAGDWDPRFGDIRTIALLDYLRLLRDQSEAGARTAFARKRHADLRHELGMGKADLVVSIMWNTDNTDVDLHVHEPRGGHCYYGHPTTRLGGRLTADVTQGYGPEMYVIEDASRGRYDIDAHFYASDRNRMSARTKVYATIIEDYGSPQERVSRKVLTLEYGNDVHRIATIKAP